MEENDESMKKWYNRFKSPFDDELLEKYKE